MSSLLFCAVDLGAESGRVVEGRFDGARLQLEVAHRFANLPARTAGTLRWDVLRLWNDIEDGLSKVEGEVAGIGVDTWGVDFGLLDARDQLIANPIHYRDAGHDGYLDRAAQTMPRSEIYARTGLQFLPFNTLYQLMAQRDHSPTLPLARTLLFVPDLLHFWLCGAKKNEYSIASTSQMLDVRARLWDEELLRLFGLPTQILCDLVPPGSKLGQLRSDVAARVGLSAKTPIIAPAAHDTASAIAAVPFAPDSNAAYLSSGTWSLMGLELDQPLLSERAFELGFTNEGGVAGTIRFLKNIAGLWLVQQVRRSLWRSEREYSYAELTELAARAGDDGPFIEPDDARFGAPDDMVRRHPRVLPRDRAGRSRRLRASWCAAASIRSRSNIAGRSRNWRNCAARPWTRCTSSAAARRMSCCASSAPTVWASRCWPGRSRRRRRATC